MNNSPISAANWSFLTRVWFGSGRATEIVAALAEIGAVTSPLQQERRVLGSVFTPANETQATPEWRCVPRGV